VFSMMALIVLSPLAGGARVNAFALPDSRMQHASASATVTQIMPLGDSLTLGTGTCNPMGSDDCTGYREPLWNDLTGGGYSVDFVGSLGAAFQGMHAFDTNHEGHGGRTADYIRDRIYNGGYGGGNPDNWLSLNPPEVILLHIGTNDISESQDPAAIAVEINQILNEIDEYEGDHSVVITVILAKIINRKFPNSPQGMKTTQLNNEIQSVYNTRHAAGDAIILVDMESALNYPGDFPSGDSIHPTQAGYGKMADVWLAALDGLLDPTNAAPTVFDPGDQTNAEGDTVSLTITASDPDPSDTWTFSADGLPPNLSINLNTGEISGTLTANASNDSPYSVEVTATDDGMPPLSGSTAFTWTVTDVNHVPVVTNPGNQGSLEQDMVNLQIVASDPDSGDVLTYDAGGTLPQGLSINTSTGLISGTIPLGGSSGSPYHVQITVQDDGNPVMSKSVSFDWVVSQNNPPNVTIPNDQVGYVGQQVSLQIMAADPNGEDLTFGATGLPPALSIDENSGLIEGVILPQSIGNYTTTVTVNDSAPENEQIVTFNWTVEVRLFFPAVMYP
jgi:lysophospholipase L1-like esterase